MKHVAQTVEEKNKLLEFGKVIGRQEMKEWVVEEGLPLRYANIVSEMHPDELAPR